VLSNLNDQSNSVPLKEYLLTIFAFEREMTDREKVFVNLGFELAERALQLDHVEMLRRLDLLNHAQEDARQKEASFVRRADLAADSALPPASFSGCRLQVTKLIPMNRVVITDSSSITSRWL
jgi:hypothetical protein